ncbi:MAG: hypothetical protein H0V16_06795 [Burkholderiaceae bacterium]|nr:hypothetical protein [Burkholderiaceae bacterium]
MHCPVRVLWGDRGVVNKLFTPVVDWAERSHGPVTGATTPSGHYIPEDTPDLLIAEMQAFFTA